VPLDALRYLDEAGDRGEALAGLEFGLLDLCTHLGGQ